MQKYQLLYLYKALEPTEKPIFIYGINEAFGCVGQAIYSLIKLQKNIIFCDSKYKTMKEINGISVISEKEMIGKYSDSMIIVCNYLHSQERIDFLLNNNIKKENIYNANIFIDLENEYFHLFSPKENKIFADVGALDGETTINFTKWCNNSYEKNYLFEPDKNSMKLAVDNLENNNITKVTFLTFGLWHEKDNLKFSCAGSSSTITDDGESEIELNSLDNYLQGEPVTFIKMDIEGAELNALVGAKNTIIKHRPKLAISVYHKSGDIISIPQYLKSLVPRYNFYLRHYTNCFWETVLYAIYDENL